MTAITAQAVPAGGLALAAVLAACGARTQLSAPDCDADAITYCEANGCPLSGPPPVLMYESWGASWETWCRSVGPFATRVGGFGDCADASGQTVAVDVETWDSRGDTVELYYSPTSGQIVGASTSSTRGGQSHGTCLGDMNCELIGLNCGLP